MGDFEQHLAPDVLHRLVEAAETGLPDGERENAERHMAACSACRERLEAYRKAQRGLEALRIDASDEAKKGPDCPPESEWTNLAAGLLASQVAANRVAHAARCAFCGSLLREAMETVSSELSDDDRRLLLALPSASAENQERLAAHLAVRAGRRLSFSRRLWVWGLFAAAALALAAFLFLARRGNAQSGAAKLLARAYSSHRILELRVPGAAYAPLSTVRGAGAPAPLPLLRAEVLIDRRLASHPHDPVWIALEGRAQLLQGNFQQARSTLRQALRVAPDSPSILTDLATAEYELAIEDGRDEDYMSAAEHLSRALHLRPNDPVALFNRALVYERIGSLPLALKDWQHYLRLDPSSAWSTHVARRHLDRLKKRLGASPQGELPPSDPAAAAAWLGKRLKEPIPPPGTLGSADEHLLDVAVRQWLPEAYAAGAAPTARQKADAALDRLAQELVRRHRDHWLADVLASRPSPSLTSGLAALAKAVRLNEAGRVDEGQKQAARAVTLLHAARSPAAIRAETELAYAFQRESDSSARCLAAVRSTLGQIGDRSYPWIRAQLLLERASCEAVEWHFGASRRVLLEAARLSRSHAYGVLYLRATGFLAECADVVGDRRLSWRRDRVGLRHFWTGFYPPMRASQFYADMVFGAEAADDWSLAEGLARESAGMIAQTSNRPMEAAARFRLATIANLAGDPATARVQFRRAAHIFSILPPDPTTESYQVDIQIYLADIEVQTGSPRSALARLLRVRPMAKEASEGAVAADYLRALGEAYLAEGRVTSAERALVAAVAIAERGLDSLQNSVDRVSWTETYAGVYRGLTRAELFGRHDPSAALAVWEWYRSGPIRAAEAPATKPLRGPLAAAAKPATLAKRRDISRFRAMIETQLAAERSALGNRNVVGYAQFRDGIEIWLLDARGIESHWVAVPRTKFDAVVRRFDRECANPNANLAALRSDGRLLYNWLVAPVAARLAHSRVLTLETDQAIARVPFQALIDARGEYLGKRFAIVLSPGLAYERALRSSPAFSTGDRVLSIGAPAVGPEWQSMFAPLPEADAEARAVAAHFRSATLLIGPQATLHAVLRDLPETQILHFAGHALVAGGRPGLLLAVAASSRRKPDEEAALLAASRLSARNLRECRLAVLSACATAQGEDSALVDPRSLVGAFLLAGVPDVVASRWNVNSSATAALMSAFYRRLLSGDSVPRALAAAAAFVERDPATARPYFWAAFSAYGR